MLGKLFSEEIKIGDVDVDSIDLMKRLPMELKRKVKVKAFKNNVTIKKKIQLLQKTMGSKKSFTRNLGN